MKLAYYPGCTLHSKAMAFNESALSAVAALGVELVEMGHWHCCGGVFPLAGDNLMGLMGGVHVLSEARRQNAGRLVTLCSACFNVLRRTNRLLQSDPDKCDRVNLYLADKGESYHGEVEVLHLLEVIRDEVGFDRVRSIAGKPLTGLRVAPYYGCLLLRPSAELRLDDPERPRLLHHFLASLGCEVVDFPYQSECCGAYLALGNPDVAIQASYSIVSSAVHHKADILATSCPLCQFNIDDRQREMSLRFPNFRSLPTLYFTELLALALGQYPKSLGTEGRYVDPRPVLERQGILAGEPDRVEIPGGMP